jgi:hypothetical protein
MVPVVSKLKVNRIKRKENVDPTVPRSRSRPWTSSSPSPSLDAAAPQHSHSLSPTPAAPHLLLRSSFSAEAHPSSQPHPHAVSPEEARRRRGATVGVACPSSPAPRRRGSHDRRSVVIVEELVSAPQRWQEIGTRQGSAGYGEEGYGAADSERFGQIPCTRRERMSIWFCWAIRKSLGRIGKAPRWRGPPTIGNQTLLHHQRRERTRSWFGGGVLPCPRGNGRGGALP